MSVAVPSNGGKAKERKDTHKKQEHVDAIADAVRRVLEAKEQPADEQPDRERRARPDVHDTRVADRRLERPVGQEAKLPPERRRIHLRTPVLGRRQVSGVTGRRHEGVERPAQRRRLGRRREGRNELVRLADNARLDVLLVVFL